MSVVHAYLGEIPSKKEQTLRVVPNPKLAWTWDELADVLREARDVAVADDSASEARDFDVAMRAALDFGCVQRDIGQSGKHEIVGGDS